MKTLLRVGAAFVVCSGMACLITRAAEFSLNVRDLTLAEAMNLPGARGAFGTLSAVQPSHVQRLPETESKHPLFGVQVRQDGVRRTAGSGMVFLFDESQGTGKGYDRLVVDLNQNGDLTDDPVWKRLDGDPVEAGGHFERHRFGPLVMPAAAKVGDWQPRLYVEAMMFNLEFLRGGPVDGSRHVFLGQMRLLPGNLLVANVEIQGVKQQIGLVEGNLNFRIGDPAMTAEYTRTPGRTTWQLMPADYLLRDLDGSGTFQDRPGQHSSEPLASFTHFNGEPFSLTLAEDLTSIRLEPYAGNTGQLDFGKHVAWLTVGRQLAGGSWEAISPALDQGKTAVPTGTYRVANLALQSTDARRIRLTSFDVPLKPLEVASDTTLKVEVGTPIRLEVTAQKRTPRPGETVGVMSAIRGMFGGRGAEETILEIGVTVLGCAGEAYSGFSAGDGQRLAPPRFEILAEGKPVTTGNFEYG
jgi:hypothetical protein